MAKASRITCWGAEDRTVSDFMGALCNWTSLWPAPRALQGIAQHPSAKGWPTAHERGHCIREFRGGGELRFGGGVNGGV